MVATRKEGVKMLQKILYPTDFSEVSLKALEYIKHLESAGIQSVIVLHVINERGFVALESFASADAQRVERELMSEAQEELEAVAKELEDCGFEVKTRLEIGHPLKEILRIEAEEGVSLIVVGSHGKSNLEEVFLGSVSEKVVRKCKSPILIVKR